MEMKLEKELESTTVNGKVNGISFIIEAVTLEMRFDYVLMILTSS